MPSDCKSEVIYDSKNFLVRHIQNKSASVHFGLGSKWCVTMKDKSYFEDYDKMNVVFFFVFNKHLTIEDTNYKLACSIQRDKSNITQEINWWNAIDQQITLQDITKQLDDEFELITSKINEVAKSAPKSLLAKMMSDEATEKEMEICYDSYKNEENVVVRKSIVSSIIRSPNCPESLYKEMIKTESDEIISMIIFHRNFPISLAQYCAKFANDNIKSQIVTLPNLPKDLFHNLCYDLVKSNSNEIKTEILSNLNFPKDIFLNVCYDLANVKNVKLKAAIANNPNCPKDLFQELQFVLAKSADDNIRTQLAANKNLSPDIIRDFVKDKNVEVRSKIAMNPSLPVEFMKDLASDDKMYVQQSLAQNPNLSEPIIKYLVQQHENLAKLGNTSSGLVIKYICKNPSMPKDMLLKFANDGNYLHYVLLNKHCPEEVFENAIKNHNDSVRLEAVRSPNFPVHLMKDVVNDELETIRKALVHKKNCPEEVLRDLVNDENPEIAQEALKAINMR